QIGECVSCRNRLVARIEGQSTVRGHTGLRDLVFLRGYKITTELQVVGADYPGDVVTVGVGRIGIQRAVRKIAGVFPDAAVDTTTQTDAGDLPPKSVLEKS